MTQLNSSLIKYHIKTKFRAINHHITWWMSLNYPMYFPHVHIIGFPKSGTTWITQLVSEVTNIKFYREALFPVLCNSVLHGHNKPSNKMYDTIFVVRDGRDVMVSLYHHIVRYEKSNNAELLDISYIREVMPKFIEKHALKPYSCNLNWSDYYYQYKKNARHMHFIKYEDLKKNPHLELSKVVNYLSLNLSEDLIDNAIKKFDFNRIKSLDRNTGKNESFLRKGVVGDWQKYFTPEACKVFEKYHGNVLRELGYVDSKTWW